MKPGRLVSKFCFAVGTAEDTSSIPGSAVYPEGGNSSPLQYSCQDNPVDTGAWWAPVHGVTKSWT